MIYDITMTTLIAMEKKINSYLRRWLGLPQSLSSFALYGPTNSLQVSFKGLTEEYMVPKTREVMMFKDPKVETASIELRTGRRWNSSLELQITGERLRHKHLVGTVAVGLGYCTSKDIRKATGEEYWHLLQNGVRAGLEELR